MSQKPRNIFHEVAKRIRCTAEGENREIPEEIVKAISEDFYKLARELGIAKYTREKGSVGCLGDNYEWAMLRDLYKQMLMSALDWDNLMKGSDNMPEDLLLYESQRSAEDGKKGTLCG